MPGERGGRVAFDEAPVVSAVRYALHRSTYVVKWTVDEVLRVWVRLLTSVGEHRA